jgi:D-alanyl-D-alanine carboxypeptidase
MKKYLFYALMVTSIIACEKAELSVPVQQGQPYQLGANPRSDSLHKLMQKYVRKGIPGAVIGVKNNNGLWMGAAGFASLEEKIRMTPQMLHTGRSITKMVTATAIMQLKERGMLRLDDPIKNYLPPAARLVPETGIVTVRMLLNHTSGYSEYINENEFLQRWLDNPLTVWTRAELESLIKRRTRLLFRPGSDFKYSNTNYYLLSLIIDHVTGAPHGQWFQQHIFNKLGLVRTFYKQSPGYPFYPNQPNTYFPRFDNGVLENNTRVHLAWEQNEEYGTVGVIATPEDYLRFMEGLVNGKLVNAASLNEMKQWVQGSASSEPDYGLGLSYWGYRNQPNFGHDGDAVGAHTLLLYFPASATYVFIGVNVSTQFGGSIEQVVSEFRNEVCNYLASF